MAHVTNSEQMQYIELNHFAVDINDGDVVVFDSVKDISPLYPLKPKTTLIAACSQGWQKMTANGQGLELKSDTILICPPNLHISGGEHSPDFECKVVCISDQLVRTLLRHKVDIWHHTIYVNQVNLITIPAASKEDLGFYFSLIRSKLKRNHPVSPFEILLALLRAFLLELCFMMTQSHGESHERRPSQGKVLFNRFLSLISNSKMKRQPINSYASQLAITPKYLTMLCLKYSNKTASEWVAQYTVEEIRFYLKSTDLSIKEISALLGFSNMSHFGSFVRKHLSASPSEFRSGRKSQP